MVLITILTAAFVNQLITGGGHIVEYGRITESPRHQAISQFLGEYDVPFFLKLPLYHTTTSHILALSL